VTSSYIHSLANFAGPARRGRNWGLSITASGSLQHFYARYRPCPPSTVVIQPTGKPELLSGCNSTCRAVIHARRDPQLGGGFFQAPTLVVGQRIMCGGGPTAVGVPPCMIHCPTSIVAAESNSGFLEVGIKEFTCAVHDDAALREELEIQPSAVTFADGGRHFACVF
jgi:hypothetical protein